MPCSVAGGADCRPLFRGLLLGQGYADSINSETVTRFVDSMAPAGSWKGPHWTRQDHFQNLLGMAGARP